MLRRIRAVLALTLWSASSIVGQSTFGDIVGVVKDPGMGLVPGAQVTLTNVDDGSQHTATTDADGAFHFVNLKAGHYEMLVHADGFADSKISSSQLDARQTLRFDVTLKLATSAQSIEVAGDVGPLINTENATLSNIESNAEITKLPINSRAVSSSPLAALATNPNVASDSQGNVSVGGSTAAQTGFSVDGISTANVRANGALKDAYPSMEGIQEMNVTAFNNNAEFAQIGDVTFTTKSGTTRFHGSAFEYFQNDRLDSTIYNFSSKAPKTFNSFGGSLGGPVMIPKLWNGGDKTFFFVDYEGNRKHTSTPELLLVPTAAERAGNLSGMVGGAPLMDPFTGAAYPNNTIPGGAGNQCSNSKDCINPVAQALLNNYYPLPNANRNGYNYQTLVSIPSNSNAWALRIDRTLTSKQQLYARYSWKNVFLNEFNNDTVIAPANIFLPNDQGHEQNRSLVVSCNYVITPKLVNEFRVGVTNFKENETFPIQGAQALSQLGLVLNNGINLAMHPTGQAFPTFAFSDGTINSIGQGRVGTTISRTLQFTDNVSRIGSHHALRFGMDVRRVLYNAPLYYAPSDDFGSFQFTAWPRVETKAFQGIIAQLGND